MTAESMPRRLDLLFGTLIEITGQVVGEDLPDGMIRSVLRCAIDAFELRGAWLAVPWDGGPWIQYTARRGALRGGSDGFERQTLESLGGAAQRAFRRCETVELPGEEGPHLLIPLREGREAVGVLGLWGRAPGTMGEETRRLAQVLADAAGVALRVGERHRAIERMGLTDALTGAFNYRYLLEAVAHEIERARRFGDRFSLLMLDVDNLKAYNDVHGHLQGSQVLRRVSELARSQLRGVDVLGKYGGDEFVIVLPQALREGALQVAERIRRSIEEHPFPGEEVSGRITSSLGVSTFPDDGATVEELIDHADVALYRAKRLGRNQVAPWIEQTSWPRSNLRWAAIAADGADAGDGPGEG